MHSSIIRAPMHNSIIIVAASVFVLYPAEPRVALVFLARADAGNPVTPAPHVPFEHRVEAPPYVQELASKFAAVSMRVVLRGQSCFYHNGMCRKLFMSSEAANEMYTANKQVCAPIHP